MTAITFDTLAYSKTLQSAGMPQEQADALAKAQKAALDEMVAAKELATQADILMLKLRSSLPLSLFSSSRTERPRLAGAFLFNSACHCRHGWYQPSAHQGHPYAPSVPGQPRSVCPEGDPW